MNQPAPATFRFLLLTFFLTVLLGLGGCADRELFVDAPLDRPDPLEGAEVALPETAEPEFEDLEMQMCLDEELVTLGQTDIWQKSTAPVTLHPSDSVVYDFPIVHNNQVEMYLNLFQTRQRKHFALWLARSTAYRQIMEEELATAGLPRDLVYLSMIESGFSQSATSRAKAVGLWQFMAGTGKQYHLRIDAHVDERRDVLKSTRAAVQYLADLYQEFGDWHLAVAAYNGGPGRIRKGLSKYKVNNFWDLAGKKYLPLETSRYVPKLIAALLIAKEPERFGFTAIDYHPPLNYESITVPGGLSLEAIALVSGSTVKEIKRLNQHLRQPRTPSDTGACEVNVPAASAALASDNLARLHSTVNTGYISHTIRTGETLAGISKHYGINRTTLLKVNDLRSGKLVAGRNLRIPRNTISYSLLPANSAGRIMAANRDSLILHQVAKGDTLSAISSRYSVPIDLVVSWNGLRNRHTLQIGQQLALYINTGSAPATLTSAPSPAGDNSSHTALRAGEYKRRLVGNDERSHLYSVRRGDSLWTISRRFSASPQDIKSWNNLKSDRILPGNTLIIHEG